MFVFWNRRTVLTKRLLKAKVRGEHETECETQEDSSSRTHRTNEKIGAGNDTSGNVTTKTTSKRITTTQRVPSSTLGGGTTTTTTTITTTGGGERSSARTSSSRLQQGCCGGDRSHDDDEDPNRLLRCKEFLKTLKENQLEMLLSAVERCGADLGSCILVPRQRPFQDSDSDSELDDRLQQDNQQQQQQDMQYHRSHRAHHRHFHHFYYLHHRHHHHHLRHHRRRRHSPEEEENENEESRQQRHRGSIENASMDPHLLCCQIWRWPDLAHTDELKRLPVCHSARDPVYVCCNPYHWSRLYKPESPPPPYCVIADRLKPEDRAPSEGDQRWRKNSTPLPLPGSLTTNGEGETGQKEWCTLAYWELGGRVGRLYPVEPSTVNVFDSLHDGDGGLCLSTLAENHAAPPSVRKTRKKIGLGLMLSQEADGVWAYNRSKNPIFVNSPTLDDPESRTPSVYRVPPGFCLNIFDRTKILQHPAYNGGGNTRTGSNAISAFPTGPIDLNSVRISFVKGWGPAYSRQEVTSCPCWLEVLLAPCR